MEILQDCNLVTDKQCRSILIAKYQPLKILSVDDVAFFARRPKGALAFKALPSEHHFAQDGRKRPCIGRVCGDRKEVCRSAKHCQSSLGGA